MARAVSRDLQDLARLIDRWLAKRSPDERIAFSLFVWTPKFANYISSADRAQIIDVLEQMIARWKAGMPDIPTHERQ